MQRAATEHILHLIVFYKIEVAACAAHSLLIEGNVEHLALTHKLGILGKEERQTLKLECEGEVGTHYIAAVAEIPLAEKPRRSVDRHHKRLRIVDILYKRGETAL